MLATQAFDSVGSSQIILLKVDMSIDGLGSVAHRRVMSTWLAILDDTRTRSALGCVRQIDARKVNSSQIVAEPDNKKQSAAAQLGLMNAELR